MSINIPTKTNFITFKSNNNTSTKKLPLIKYETPKKRDPGNLPDVSFFMRKKIITQANKLGVCIDDYLRSQMAHLTYIKKIEPEASISALVGKTKVTTLIDGEQIFDKTLEFVKSAEKSIQVEMFEFQNLNIDSHKWPSRGAEMVPGWEEQQKILDTLIKKKRENPNLKIQIILDAHKWYMNGFGAYDRHYNNQDMIRYLLLNGIDVVPYPRAAQQGAALQHVKLLAVDSKKIILGGMNWGTHSVANHDACIAIETNPKYKHSEVDNIIEEIFNKDWKFAWQRLANTKVVAGPLEKEEQQLYTRLKKEIKPENVEYQKLVGDLYNNPNLKDRYNTGSLDIIQVQPIANPAFKILTTKPKELSLINEQGSESIGDFLKERVKTAKTIRAELFVLSHKEIIENIIKRYKAGELDAKFIVSSDILEQFPYCRKAYQKLVDNNVPVRLYNADKKIDQRLHCKWAVFDNKELIIGSVNWSAMGLEQNLEKGEREDYDIITDQINNEIKNFIVNVKKFENEIKINPISNYSEYYDELISRKKELKKALKELTDFGSTKCVIDNKEIQFTEINIPNIKRVLGYYKMLQDLNNAKEKYKRGNNECAVVFEKPIIANVFLRQFNKDWVFSENKYEKEQNQILDMEI